MKKGEMKQAAFIRGVRVLRIIGDFTNDTTPDFQKICKEVATSEGTKGVLLDFEGVSAIDTSAFACMVNFIGEHKSAAVDIGIINLKMGEEDLMEILKLSGFIKVFDDQEEAISVLSKK